MERTVHPSVERASTVCILSICRGQALAVALMSRRKAVPLPRTIEKIQLMLIVMAQKGPISEDWTFLIEEPLNENEQQVSTL